MNALGLLESGIDNWNQWRSQHPHVPIDLAKQDLSHGYFFEGNLRGANLNGANLQRACLIGADLTGANLIGADLTGAYLGDANLTGANLSKANLKDASLDRADLRRTNLLGTNIIEADIRTAQLPDPNTDPYMDEVVGMLFRQRLAASASLDMQDTQNVQQRERSAYSTAIYRQSLLRQMVVRMPALTRESDRAIATRQQAIRQSAVLVHKVKRRPQVKRRPHKNLGRRKTDRRFMASAKRHIRQQSRWVIAIGLLLLFGLVTGFYKVYQTPMTAQAQATSFALSRSLAGSSQVWAIATHPLGEHPSLVAGGNKKGEIEIWNSRTGKLIQKFKGHPGRITTIATSQSGDWLVSGSLDGIKVWHLKTGELKYKLPGVQTAIRLVAISPDGQTFLSSDCEGTLSAWQLSTGEQLYSVDQSSSIGALAIAPDGQTFITGSDSNTSAVSSSESNIQQWNLATGQLIQDFDSQDFKNQSFGNAESSVRAIAISPDGQTLASSGHDNIITLWDIASGQLKTTLATRQGEVLSLAISADSKTLASSTHQTIELWDIPGQKLTDTIESSSTVALAFDPVQRALIGGRQDRGISIWQ